MSVIKFYLPLIIGLLSAFAFIYFAMRLTSGETVEQAEARTNAEDDVREEKRRNDAKQFVSASPVSSAAMQLARESEHCLTEGEISDSVGKAVEPVTQQDFTARVSQTEWRALNEPAYMRLGRVF